MACNDFAISPGQGCCSRVGPELKQWNGCGLDAQVLTVQARHQPELPLRATWFGGNPTADFRAEADPECHRVTGERPWLMPPDLSSELIEQKDKGES